MEDTYLAPSISPDEGEDDDDSEELSISDDSELPSIEDDSELVEMFSTFWLI